LAISFAICSDYQIIAEMMQAEPLKSKNEDGWLCASKNFRQHREPEVLAINCKSGTQNRQFRGTH